MTVLRRSVLVLLLAVSAVFTGPLSQAVPINQWPMYHGGPDHLGVNYAEMGIGVANASKLKLVWKAPTGGNIVYSSPAVVGGVVYLGSSDGQLYAFRASDGKRLWTGPTGGGVVTSPAVGNGVVYIGSSDGKVYAFPAAGCGAPTCSPLWTGDTGDTIISSPTLAAGRIFIGSRSEDDAMFVFDAAGCGAPTCAPLAIAPAGETDSTPGYANGVVYFSAYDAYVYAFPASCSGTCTPIWKFGTGAPIDSSPAITGGVVYVGSADFKLYAINAATGLQKWQFSTLATTNFSSPAVAYGKVYIGSWDGGMYAVNQATGKLAWRFSDATGFGFCSPAIANGVLFADAYQDGAVYALDAKTGKLLWAGKAGVNNSSSPVVAGGTLYISSGDGNLYAFRPKATLP
jgi:outer membrane protein assembly factor BamB